MFYLKNKIGDALNRKFSKEEIWMADADMCACSII